MIKLARFLRKNQTLTEKRLWSHLRSRQLKKAKFRRQHPIGPYIVDFYCHKTKLAIELDGSGHLDAKQKLHDKKRQEFLSSQDIRTIRFWDHEIWEDLNSVLERIWNETHP